MIDHLIWAMGILGDFLILVVLFTRRRFPQFPWFTLLIAFHFAGAVGLKIASHLSGHEVGGPTATILGVVDVLLLCAVLAELTRRALRPVAGFWRLMLLLLLVVCGVLVALRFSPAAHRSLSDEVALMHSVLSVLRLEWAIVLAFLLRTLRLSWRSHVAAISFGLGAFSAHQLAADGFFATGPGMIAYLATPFSRISVYLLILSWWLVTLYLTEPARRDASVNPTEALPVK